MGDAVPRPMSGLAKARRDRILGLSFVLCVALIWVAGSFIVKDIEKELPAAVVTYVANALLVVLLPAAKLREWMKARRRRWGRGCVWDRRTVATFSLAENTRLAMPTSAIWH